MQRVLAKCMIFFIFYIFTFSVRQHTVKEVFVLMSCTH